MHRLKIKVITMVAVLFITYYKEMFRGVFFVLKVFTVCRVCGP